MQPTPPFRTASCPTLAALALLAATALPAATAAAQVSTPSPFVERLEPTAGPPGTEVEMIGRHFRSDQTVLLGDVEMEVRARRTGRWRVVIPAGAHSGHLVIRLADGTTVTGPELRVTEAAPAPTISSIAPTTATVGAEVHLRGTGFSSSTTEHTVTLNGTPVVVRSASPTELVVLVPAGATDGPFVVSVRGGAAAQSPPLTVSAGLTITGFEPSVAAPGMRVTIRGTGFDARASRNRVSLGGVTMRVREASATALVVEVPARGASGTIVVSPRGGGTVTSEATLTVQAMPVIRALSPASGVPGARIAIEGSHFGTDIRAVSVTLGERPMTLRAVTDTRIEVEIPATGATGPVSVTVGGLPAVTSSEALEVVVPPSIASFAPLSGPAGTEVTITGVGFRTRAEANRVTMGSAACEVLGATPTELRVRIPGGASGALVVEVEDAGTARTSQPFVVTTPPTIATFSPARGEPGSVVTITGTNFGSSAARIEVTVGGVHMDVRSVTETSLEAVVPSREADGPIAVTVRLQGSATSAASFRVLMPLSVAAEAHTARPAQTVVLRGGGFTEGTTVRFAGMHADAAVTRTSSSELRVLVPEGAETGPIVVRTDDGREASGSFTLAPDPEGAGIDDVRVSCSGRTCTVSVRGWGFGTSARAITATVLGARARVRSASPHFLELSVRHAPGHGVVHVELRGGPSLDSAAIDVE